MTKSITSYSKINNMPTLKHLITTCVVDSNENMIVILCSSNLCIILNN